jgi:predicted MFS family arabinose efflux permease
VLLDLAVQGNLVLSQQEIYQLRPDARSRINTVFIGSVFLGGAIGSALSGLLYHRGGWAGVTTLGFVLPTIGFGLWCGSQLRGRRAGLALADHKANAE